MKIIIIYIIYLSIYNKPIIVKIIPIINFIDFFLLPYYKDTQPSVKCFNNESSLF